MGLITVEGIRVFAYHGHLPEEAILGGTFYCKCLGRSRYFRSRKNR